VISCTLFSSLTSYTLLT